VWVAIDVAKAAHQVLVESPDGRRRSMRIANTQTEIERLVTYLQALPSPCTIAFEPTGDYHRAVMYRLGQAGFDIRQVSSLAVARTRDAMYNSWDKNDPKDAQVILHLLKTGRHSASSTRSSRDITTCRRWRTPTSRCPSGRCVSGMPS
jgi:transposase